MYSKRSRCVYGDPNPNPYIFEILKYAFYFPRPKQQRDVHLVAEFLETLRAFGCKDEDPLIRRCVPKIHLYTGVVGNLLLHRLLATADH